MGVRWTRHSRHVTRGPRWKALRMAVLERDGWACVRCASRRRLEVDHIRPVRTHPQDAHDPANLQTLCAPCHTRKTRIECGHPPLSDDRQKWRRAVAEMTRGKKPSSTKGTSDA